jgi:hypothetical protein
VKLQVELRLTPAQLAEIFCDWGDEDMAQFFIECAKIASMWDAGGFLQWRLTGGHLRDCACSTDDARELVREIAAGMEQPRAAPPDSPSASASAVPAPLHTEESK